MTVLMPVLAGLFLLCAQLFLREAFALDAWTPDLVTVLVLWLGTARDAVRGPIVAAIVGILAAGFMGSPLGLHMLHAILLFYAATLISEKVHFEGIAGWLLLGLLGGVLSQLLFAGLTRVFLGDTLLGERLGGLLVPRVVGVLVFTPPLAALLTRLDGLRDGQNERDLLG